MLNTYSIFSRACVWGFPRLGQLWFGWPRGIPGQAALGATFAVCFLKRVYSGAQPTRRAWCSSKAPKRGTEETGLQPPGWDTVSTFFWRLFCRKPMDLGRIETAVGSGSVTARATTFVGVRYTVFRFMAGGGCDTNALTGERCLGSHVERM